MTPEDRALLGMVCRLQRTLSPRTVLLRHAHSDVDVFTEGLRDLGNDLTDIGKHCLDRVAELDAWPIDGNKHQSRDIVTVSACSPISHWNTAEGAALRENETVRAAARRCEE